MSLLVCDCTREWSGQVSPPEECVPCWDTVLAIVKGEAKRQCRNRYDADDVAGTVLVEIKQKWPQTDARKPETALKQLINFRAIDFYRDQKRREDQAKTLALTCCQSDELCSYVASESQYLMLDLLSLFDLACDREAVRRVYWLGQSWRQVSEEVAGPSGERITQQAWGQRIRPTFQAYADQLRDSLSD